MPSGFVLESPSPHASRLFHSPNSTLDSASAHSHTDLIEKARLQQRSMPSWTTLELSPSAAMSPSSHIASPTHLAADAAPEESPKYRRLATRLAASSVGLSASTNVTPQSTMGLSPAAVGLSLARGNSRGDLGGGIVPLSPSNRAKKYGAREQEFFGLTKQLETAKAALQASQRNAENLIRLSNVVAAAEPFSVAARSDNQTPTIGCLARMSVGGSPCASPMRAVLVDNATCVIPSGPTILARRCASASTLLPSPSSVSRPSPSESIGCWATDKSRAWAQAHADAADTAAVRAVQLEEMQQINAQQALQLLHAHRQIAELRYRSDGLVHSVDEARSEANRAESLKVLAKERGSLAEHELARVKEDNLYLQNKVLELEKDLRGKTTNIQHQSRIINETQAMKETAIGSLRRELLDTEARLRDTSMKLLSLQHDDAQRELHRQELEKALNQRTADLELARASAIGMSMEKINMGHLEALQKQCAELTRQVQDLQRQHLIQREQSIAACRAEVERCQQQCRDMKNAHTSALERCEEYQRGLNFSELSRTQLERELVDATELLSVERAAAQARIREVQAGAELAQRGFVLEVDASRREAVSLRERIAFLELKVQQSHSEIGGLERYRDETAIVSETASCKDRLNIALVGDLTKNLSTTVSELSDARRRITEQQATAEALKDGLEIKIRRLELGLEEARRNVLTLQNTLEANEKRCASTEEKLRTAFDETEGHSKMAFDELLRDNKALSHKAYLLEQTQQELCRDAEITSAKHRSSHAVVESELEHLRREYDAERATARAKAGLDESQIEELRRENARLVAQNADYSAQVASLDALHIGLREHAQVLGRGQ